MLLYVPPGGTFKTALCPHRAFQCSNATHSKQPFFPYIALADWLLNRRQLHLLWRTKSIFTHNGDRACKWLCLGSTLGQSMLHLWLKQWPWHRFLFQYFIFPLQYHSTSAANHLTPYTTLIKRRNRQRWGAFIKSNAFLDIRWHCTGHFCHTVSIQNINVQANILQFSTSCSDSNMSVPIYMSQLLQYHPTAMSTLRMALSSE